MTKKKLSSVESPDSIKGIMARAPDSWAKLPFNIRIAKAARIFRAKLPKKDILKYDPNPTRGGDKANPGRFSSKTGGGAGSSDFPTGAGGSPGDKRKILSKRAGEIIAATKDNGGFTINYDNFEDFDLSQGGFAVGIGARFAGATNDVFEGISPRTVARKINGVKAQIRDDVMLSDEFTAKEKARTHIGGYINLAGELEIEPSLAFPPGEYLDAVQLAVNLDEEAIFDFSTFENIFIKDLNLKELGINVK